jgi:hypothetical protein
MDAEQLSSGITDADATGVSTVPAGKMAQLDWAVLGQVFREPLKEMPGSFHDLMHLQGSDRGWHDLVPNLYSFVALAHHERISLRERTGLFAAMSDGICWNGDPIPGMSAADRAVLDDLARQRAGEAASGPAAGNQPV